MKIDTYRSVCLMSVLSLAVGCSAARQHIQSLRPHSTVKSEKSEESDIRKSSISETDHEAESDSIAGQEIAKSEYEIHRATFTTSDALDSATAQQLSDVVDQQRTPGTLPTTSIGLDSQVQQNVGATLDQVINTCLLANPTLRAGFETINQAQGDFFTSTLKPNPTLFTDMQLLPLTRSFTVTKQGGPPQQDVIAAYPIDWFLFGKRAAAMVSASHGVRVAEAVYADLIRRLTAETAFAFYDVLEAKSLLEVARQDTASLTRLESVTTKAVEAGGRPPVELNRVRLDLLRSQQILRETEATVAINKAKLQALLGFAETDPDFEVDGKLDAPQASEPPSTEEAFQLALQNRPDIQALRWQQSQAQANTTLEYRKAFPEVAPALGYTRQYQTKAIGFPDADSWSASINMSVPLFDRNQGNRAKAEATFVQSGYQLQTGIVGLRSEIEQSSQQLRVAIQNSGAVATEQLQTAIQVRESITKAYAEGGRPLIDVLDAQRNYRDTFRFYITTRANYWRAVYRYNAAIGAQIVRYRSSEESRSKNDDS